MHLRCDFFSEALELSTSMTVLLPQATRSQIGLAGTVRDRTPVLYLLHGLSDDDTTWLRRTSVERYVSELGLAVVMPQVHRSFYRNGVHGGRYWDFVAEELPQLVASSFVVSGRPEDTFVAGLSMGGYGAMQLALRHPARFAAAGSLSGVLRLGPQMRTQRPRLMDQVWGDGDPTGTDDDPLQLLSRADPGALPPLWLTCGESDPLHPGNVRFAETARRRGVDLTAEFHPGDHTWDYWDTHLQRFLAWLPLAPVGTGAGPG